MTTSFECLGTTMIQKSNLLPLTSEMTQNTMKLMHWSNNYKSLDRQGLTMLPTREGTSRANKRGFLPFINVESNESGCLNN